jgi:ABC-type glycerol-3-phosphate transport system permease component
MGVRYKLRFKVFIYASLFAITLIIVIFPFYWLLKTSLEFRNNIFISPPRFIPSFTLRAYYQVLFEARTLLWMKNSLFVSVCTTAAVMFFATFTAYSLSRFHTKTNRVTGYFILATQMVPGAIYMLPIFLQFTKWSLVDKHIGAVIAFATFSLPLCVWLLKGYFDSISVEIESSALIDGCTRLGAMFRIVVPLALPGYISTIIYSFLLGWNEYVYVFVLMRSANNWLLSNGIASYFGEYSTSWDFIMASAVFYTIPPILLNFFLQKYLVQGLTAGAIKS